jgi:hypothetical protein
MAEPAAPPKRREVDETYESPGQLPRALGGQSRTTLMDTVAPSSALTSGPNERSDRLVTYLEREHP